MEEDKNSLLNYVEQSLKEKDELVVDIQQMKEELVSQGQEVDSKTRIIFS